MIHSKALAEKSISLLLHDVFIMWGGGGAEFPYINWLRQSAFIRWVGSARVWEFVYSKFLSHAPFPPPARFMYYLLPINYFQTRCLLDHPFRTLHARIRHSSMVSLTTMAAPPATRPTMPGMPILLVVVVCGKKVVCADAPGN